MSCCQGSIILWLDHECHLAKSGFPKFMSPLSLQREDSFITLDLNEIFSVLAQNFAFLPQKLIVSHGQGFRVSSYLWSSINIFAVDKVLLTVWSVWWWCRFLLKMVIHWLMALYISDTPYHLVFAGPVRWTGKKTEIELNPTEKDRTTSCGCTNSDFFSVASCDVCQKIEKPKKTGLDRLQPVFRPVICWTLLTQIFP